MAGVQIETKAPKGKKNCLGSTSGVKDPAYDYIAKAITGDDEYPEDACPRVLHGSFQVDNIQLNTQLTGTGLINVTNTITSSVSMTAPIFNGSATTAKTLGGAFDVPHMTQEGKRVRHVIPEGPEAGIYIRGTLKDNNTIQIPDYWDWLVDPETITVTLTQIKSSQDLIVDEINWCENIVIRSGNGSDIFCFYEVWGARWINPSDRSEKFHVVYEGETPDDYPGNNDKFLIGGWDYDKRDPKTGEKVDT